MKEIVNVALSQIDIEPLDPQANLARIEASAAKITAESPVDLVVFPAPAHTGHRAASPGYIGAAEAADGPFVAGLRKVARRYRTHLAAGFLETAPGEKRRAYNSATLIDPRGNIRGVQRQVHLVGEDKGFFAGGGEISVFPTALGNIALVVGDDLEYPEYLRVQALKGAEIACCLLNLNREVADPAEWLALIGMCRTMEDRVYALMCNRVGGNGDGASWGASCIIDLAGGIVAQAPLSGEAVVRGQLSHDHFVEERFAKPSFRDRRPENYGMICGRSGSPLP